MFSREKNCVSGNVIKTQNIIFLVRDCDTRCLLKSYDTISFSEKYCVSENVILGVCQSCCCEIHCYWRPLDTRWPTPGTSNRDDDDADGDDDDDDDNLLAIFCVFLSHLYQKT